MALVDPRDMLNNFCFHVYAQKSLFIGENGNAFFLPPPPHQHPILLVRQSQSWFPAKKGVSFLLKCPITGHCAGASSYLVLFSPNIDIVPNPYHELLLISGQGQVEFAWKQQSWSFKSRPSGWCSSCFHRPVYKTS